MSHKFVNLDTKKISVVSNHNNWRLAPNASYYALTINGKEIVRFTFGENGQLLVHYRTAYTTAIEVDGEYLDHIGDSRVIPDGSLVVIMSLNVIITTDGLLAEFLSGNQGDLRILIKNRAQYPEIDSALAAWENPRARISELPFLDFAVYERIKKLTDRKYEDFL